RLSEENFMSTVNFITNLKLRGSWGQLGNQNVPGGNYPYQSFISFGQGIVLGNSTLVDGAALLDAANPGLTWETSEMTNVGLDLGMFDGKLNITAEVYSKRTKDIIFDIPIPATTGLNAPPVNAGEVLNEGWDLRIVYGNKVNNFNYNIGFNLSDVKTTVVDLKETGPIFPDKFTIWEEGEEFNALYGFVADGYYQSQDEVDDGPTQIGTLAPGDIRYRDLNDDGVINADDRQIIGSTTPRYVFGLDMTADYKGFDLTIFFQGVGKRDGYLEQEAAWAFYNGGKVQEKHLDYWTPENPDAEFPRLTYTLTNNQAVSSFWRTNAAYLRLKNVQIGYTLPQSLTEAISIQRARVYAAGQNLFSIDSYDGFDPESRLGNANFYPFVTVYTLGVDITF
ncbi:MAG: SusC/RagA family TonB-linked outer membrane protein, partial [Cyclobacteriaceae bacterium]